MGENAVLRPADERELAEMVVSADGPLRVRGGGTRSVASGSDDILSVAALSGITLYEPGALTLVARAGTPLADVKAALASENQRLAFEPMDHRAILGTTGTPTIGGVVAVNASGPRRIVAGACRDSLIGVRFVDGSGTVVKNGGRVMKNVTGYDLVKLLAGSHGTLGILSEVSFKVLPGFEATATLLLDGLDPARAVAAMAAALGSPFEVSGAAHTPSGLNGTPVTMLRLEGFEASVAYRSEKLRALLTPFGDARIAHSDAGTDPGWDWVRDAECFAGGSGALWRISVKPSDGPRVVAALGDVTFLMDWAGGLIWAETDEAFDLRAALSGIAGHATLVRAPEPVRARFGSFPPEPAPLAAIARGLRTKFDPRGILNPGLMG